MEDGEAPFRTWKPINKLLDTALNGVMPLSFIIFRQRLYDFLDRKVIICRAVRFEGLMAAQRLIMDSSFGNEIEPP
ncbi:hypothetical protein [Paenibacillus sp. 2TAB19]|uniref:hypothetical protein n=1 Tax=Paenibacillus sp. 2TAB19 TaxID=3233003 RepID=UPI003F99E41C